MTLSQDRQSAAPEFFYPVPPGTAGVISGGGRVRWSRENGMLPNEAWAAHDDDQATFALPGEYAPPKRAHLRASCRTQAERRRSPAAGREYQYPRVDKFAPPSCKWEVYSSAVFYRTTARSAGLARTVFFLVTAGPSEAVFRSDGTNLCSAMGRNW